MPFIDLSTPQSNDTGSTANNNPVKPQSVANNPQPVMPQQQAANPVSVSASTPIPVNQISPTNSQQSTGLPADNMQKALEGEHDLMRDLPADLVGTPAPSGLGGSNIKVMPGPPLNPTSPVSANTMANTNLSSNNSFQPVVGSNTPLVQNDATNNSVAPTQNDQGKANMANFHGLPPLPQMNAVQNQTPSQNAANIPAQNPNPVSTQQSMQPQQDLGSLSKDKSKYYADNKPLPDIKAMDDVVTLDEKFLYEKATIADFLSLAEKRGASDLHLSVEFPPMLRIDGKLIPVGGQPLTEERAKKLFSGVMTKQREEQLANDLDVDFSYTHTTGTRFRINIFHKKGTLAGAFRLIPSRIRTIAELGLPPILYDLIQIPQGLILLAGPTGSGKSTTIASMIQELNMNYAKHIVTMEDPIEYIFPKGKSIVNQREIGSDATSFKRALREVLREDPNVVLVGEMRDYETIAMTITTAETGHLVFSTLHTNSASQTVDRMIDVFPDAQQAQVRAQLANVIAAVVSQRLIPVKGGGRKAALEIMIATPAIRNAIREAKTYQIDNMIQTSAELGMITLEKSLIDLIRSGDITLEQAQSYTTKPDELISLMKNN